jgi:glutamyl-tRNA reductase
MQIVHQLGHWLGEERFPWALRQLVLQAIVLSKDIRATSGLVQEEAAMARLVFTDLSKILSNLGRLEIVVAGTGKVAELFSLFHPAQAHLYFASGKNFAQAQLLAQRCQGTAISLPEVPGVLLAADVLIAATSSPHFVFSATSLSEIAAQRKKQLFIYDLALPRDVEPKAAGISGVLLKNLDHLKESYELLNRNLTLQLELAQSLIEERVDSYVQGLFFKSRYAQEPLGITSG